MTVDFKNREHFRSNSSVRVEPNFAARTLSIHVFQSGTLVLDLNKVSQANLDRATFHGFKQRIPDAAAIARDETTGKSATPAEKYAAMKRLVEHYNSGAEGWTLNQREPGEGTLLFQALMRQKPERDETATREFVTGLSRSKRDAMLNSPQLREIVSEIRAESGREVDCDELFSELDKA